MQPQIQNRRSKTFRALQNPVYMLIIIKAGTWILSVARRFPSYAKPTCKDTVKTLSDTDY